MLKIKSRDWAPYLFISPFFILFFVFGLYPIGFSMYMSFFKWTGNPNKLPEFLGMDNYSILLTEDPFFFASLGNTLVLLVTGSLLQHLFALPLAILINNRFIKGREVFKTTFFLPYITSTVAVSIIFGTLFDSRGIINAVISYFSGDATFQFNWGADDTGIKAIISTILNWKFIGWNMIIYLAGLQAIPDELYEASDLDGASTWYKHTRITLPLLIPVIFLAVSLSIIGGMQIFDEPFIITGGYDNMGGGAENSGLTAAFYLMWMGFKNFQFGRGSAIAWLLFLIIFAMTLANRWITNTLNRRNGL